MPWLAGLFGGGGATVGAGATAAGTSAGLAATGAGTGAALAGTPAAVGAAGAAAAPGASALTGLGANVPTTMMSATAPALGAAGRAGGPLSGLSNTMEKLNKLRAGFGQGQPMSPAAPAVFSPRAATKFPQLFGG